MTKFIFILFIAFSVPLAADIGLSDEELIMDDEITEDIKEEIEGIEEESFSPDAAGSVFAVSGSVTISTEDKPDSKIELQKFSEIPNGTVVETSKNGTVLIQLSRKSGYVFAEKNTKFQVNYSRNDIRNASQDNHAVIVILWKGKIRAYSPDLNIWSSFTVITPNASIGSPGGDIGVGYSESKKYTFVKTFKEYAIVKYLPAFGKRSGRSINLKEGNRVLVISSKKATVPPEPSAVTDAEREFWISKKVNIIYEKKDDKQALLIKKEVRKIDSGSIWITPLDLTR